MFNFSQKIRSFKRNQAIKLLAEKDTDALMKNSRSAILKSLIYKIGSQFLIDNDFPLHLYLELSRACNYNCPMCMRTKASGGGYFPESLAEKIVYEAAKKGATSYSLHLFGEPLINPKWDKIVSMIRNAHVDNTVLLTTNGYFMDESCCRRLVKLKVNRIFISMHSFDPDIYRKNTGGGAISVVLDNIQTFIRVGGVDSKTKLFVRLFYGPNDPPIDEKQLSWLRKLGISLEIRGYHNFAGGKNEWSTFKSLNKRWPCFHPWFTLGITVHGEVSVCCADVSVNLLVGNVFNQSVEEIWKSKAVESIRLGHLKNNFKNWGTCAVCDTWQFHPDIFFNYQKS